MATPEGKRGRIAATRDAEDPNIAVVTVSHESKANSMTTGMLEDLERLVRGLADARAVVITGEGDRHFCAGADVNSWAPMTPNQFADDWLRKGISVLDKISALPGCVIAAVNGACFGGGLELALRADVRLCSSNASFAFPETGIGAAPGWAGGPLLERDVGRTLASEMVMCGRVIDAQEALSAGLVSSVCGQEELMDRALELARAAAARSPVANAAAKRLLRADVTEDLTEIHVREGLMCKSSDDGTEGLEAFTAKRPPKF